VRDVSPKPRPTGGVTRDNRGGKQAGAGGVSVGPGKPRDSTPKKECTILGLAGCPKGMGAIDLTKNKTADRIGGKVVGAGKKVRQTVLPPSNTRDHRKN
jgi:hypothetical protein